MPWVNLPTAAGVVTLVVLLTAARTSATAATTPGTRRALLIAVSDYPTDSGFGPLHSRADLEMLRGALKHGGLGPDSIVTLEDRSATRAGVDGALASLTATATRGDAVMIHYSGHGARLPDDDGDEPDGFDEALALWGAPAHPPPGYTGADHLRDDVLGEALNRLRRALGPTGSLLVTLDSCYSGSATRSAEGAATRGGADERPRRGARTDQGGGMAESTVEHDLAPMTILSAARFDQLAAESTDGAGPGAPAGALSAALAHALSSPSTNLTGRGLFERVREEMGRTVPRQAPQLEGAADTPVWGGAGWRQEPYGHVVAINGDGTIVLDGGTLAGMLPRSRVAFLPAGAAGAAEGTPIATGVVAHASMTEATVRLDSGTSGADLTAAWVFVTASALADAPVRLRIAPELAPPRRAAIGSELARHAIVQLVEVGGDFIVRPGAGGTIETLDAQDAIVLATVHPGSGQDTRVAAAVMTFARARYLRTVSAPPSAIHVRADVVPAVVTGRLGRGGHCEPGGDALPRPELRPGDAYLLRFVNDGSLPAWVSVADVQPDGAIHALYPADRASDVRIAAGTAFLARDVCFEVEPPYGIEVLKVFATANRIDLGAMIQRGWTDTRGSAAGPLGLWFADLYAESETRSKPAVPATGLVGIDTRVLTVVRR